MTIGTATQIIISGGWSNLGVQASELLDESTLRWNLVGENSTSDQISHALPYALRSSSFIELDNVGKYYTQSLIQAPHISNTFETGQNLGKIKQSTGVFKKKLKK